MSLARWVMTGVMASTLGMACGAGEPVGSDRDTLGDGGRPRTDGGGGLLTVDGRDGSTPDGGLLERGDAGSMELDAGARDAGARDAGPGSTGPVGCQGVSPPPDFTRSSFEQFSDLRTTNGPPLMPFPNSGGGFGVLEQQHTQFTSIRFTVPAFSDWTRGCAATAAPACVIGEFDTNPITFVTTLNRENKYMTVSECLGDFRIPAPGGAPAGDPTLSLGCRSGPNSRGIDFQLFEPGAAPPSSDTACRLEFGKTYFFNVVLDGPADGRIGLDGGLPPCQAGETFCGIGLRYRTF